MYWPREHEGNVSCVGFDRRYLPALKFAVDNKMVSWKKSGIFMGFGSSHFELAGCIWKLSEMNECVTEIALIDGTLDAEELTATILKGKIETS